jgi:hypothetical protein
MSLSDFSAASFVTCIAEKFLSTVPGSIPSQEERVWSSECIVSTPLLYPKFLSEPEPAPGVMANQHQDKGDLPSRAQYVSPWPQLRTSRLWENRKF